MKRIKVTLSDSVSGANVVIAAQNWTRTSQNSGYVDVDLKNRAVISWQGFRANGSSAKEYAIVLEGAQWGSPKPRSNEKKFKFTDAGAYGANLIKLD